MRAIVFSRDRPAQLDLLLSSIRKHAPELFTTTVVIYKATNGEFQQGYDRVKTLHGETVHIRECDFQNDLEMVLKLSIPFICFLTDDDVFYRPFTYNPDPGHEMRLDPDLLTVSLRLGVNTTYCYPMRDDQSFPSGTESHRDIIKYLWRGASYDFGYPASLDGNVWRRYDLLEMLEGKQYSNPNELEDVLVKAVQKRRQKMTACYRLSTLVNIPANRVNLTHRGNRHAETHPYGVQDLNQSFLAGRRLALGRIDFSQINAAHVERELVFNA